MRVRGGLGILDLQVAKNFQLRRNNPERTNLRQDLTDGEILAAADGGSDDFLANKVEGSCGFASADYTAAKGFYNNVGARRRQGRRGLREMATGVVILRLFRGLVAAAATAARGPEGTRVYRVPGAVIARGLSGDFGGPETLWDVLLLES